MARFFEDPYMQRNQLGYEGDSFVGIEIKKLIDKFKVTHIIETGTYYGFTTLRLAEFCNVTSIELLQSHFNEAQITFAHYQTPNHIELIQGDTLDVLKRICPTKKDESLLFFLDAHWEKHCPLLDELKIIADYKIKPIICIHDFKVPDRTDLGYDTYEGQDFEYGWIQNHLIAIYGENQFDYHYNNETEGAQRGVIYIYPKQVSK